MRKSYLLLLLLFSINVCCGQEELKPDFNKAVSLLKQESFDKAITAFTSLLGRATDTQVIKFCSIYRAFSYNGLGRYSEAIADLDKAITLDPADLASYTDRGKAKAYADDYDGAKKDFLFILAYDSTDEQGQAAYYYLAKIAYAENKYKECIGYYDKLILLTPKDAELYFNRGAAKGMLLDAEAAIKDYDEAIILDAKYMEAYANRGVEKINLLRKKGNLFPTKEQTADACTDLKKAKQLGDNTVDDVIYLHCGNK